MYCKTPFHTKKQRENHDSVCEKQPLSEEEDEEEEKEDQEKEDTDEN